MLKDYIAAFDFDGVIWNSVDECFFLADKVFREMGEELLGDYRSLRNKFREGRYLAKTGDDFYITLKMIQKNPATDFEKVTYEEYYSYRETFSTQLKIFAVKFYDLRRKIQQEDPEKWLSLQGPFEGILKQLPLVKEKFKDLVICSTKDRESIRLLLFRHGLEFTIFGREDSTHKSDQIKALSEKLETPPNKIIFIDDLVENLKHVTEMGCIGVLAEWGYNNPKVWKEAKEKGFFLLTKENITGQLMTIVQSPDQERC